jgi:hypothetical protein
MRCTGCGWPIADMVVVSTHHTSEGLVRYLRCPCGQLCLQLVPEPTAATGDLLATADPQR